MDLAQLSIDPTLLDQGVWWDWDTRKPCEPRTRPHEKHLCFLIVPLGDPYYVALEEAREPHLAAIRRNGGVVPDDLARTIVGTALAKATLVGWANAERDGKSLPFSREAALAFMTEPRWHLLKTFVERAARNEQALLLNEEEKAKGN